MSTLNENDQSVIDEVTESIKDGGNYLNATIALVNGAINEYSQFEETEDLVNLFEYILNKLENHH